MVSFYIRSSKTLAWGTDKITVIANLFLCEGGEINFGAFHRYLETIPTRADSSVPYEEIQSVTLT